MKKPDKSIKRRKAAAKRGEKRSIRLRKTQAEKGKKRAALEISKKEKARLYTEKINQMLQSRMKDVVK